MWRRIKYGNDNDTENTADHAGLEYVVPGQLIKAKLDMVWEMTLHHLYIVNLEKQV